MAPRRGGALTPPEEMYGAQKMKVLTKMPRSDQAMETMKRIADQVKPLCVKYMWTVRSFEEFFPDNNGLLGMNVNWGQKIFVRLRSGHDDFMLYERVLATMLHELTHMEHGNHSADFYRFLDALTDECDALIRKGIRGSNMPWQGEGKSLGGSSGSSTAADPKAAAAAAAAAAEKRARAAGIMMGSGGQRLGGHSSSSCGGSCSSSSAQPTPETLRKLRLSAAQRRLADNQTCVATQDGASCEYSQHQHDSSSDNEDNDVSDSYSTSAAAAGGSGSSSSSSSVLTQSQMVGDNSEPGSWACDRCTLINEAAATRCSVCGADHSNSSSANADSGSSSSDDESNTTTSSTAAAAGSNSKSQSITGIASKARHPLNNSRNTNIRSSSSNSSSAKAVVKTAAASAAGTIVKASALRPDMPAQAARWRCDQCSFINSAFSERCTALGCRGEQQTTPLLPLPTATAAAMRGSSNGTPTKQQQQQQQQLLNSPLCATAAELTQWSCTVCTLVNRPLALVCECCDAIRDVSSSTNNSSSSSGVDTSSSASSSVQHQQQQQQQQLGKRRLNDAEGGDKQGEVVDMTDFD
jgi:DNA-dependent metalloprotease WSS1